MRGQCDAMHSEFHMTPFMALILIGFAVFITTLGVVSIWSKLR